MTIAVIASSAASTENKTSQSSTTLAYPISLSVGNIVFFAVGKDNHSSTTDGDGSEVTDVQDNAGNVFTKVAEHTNGQGSANAGATISFWMCQLETAVTTSDTITATYSGNTTAKCLGMRCFSVGANNTLQQAGTTQTEVVDGGTAGSLTIGSLPSKEYIFLRMTAMEDNLSNFIPTTNFSSFITLNTTGGGGATSHICLFGEYRIVTTTSQSSDPSCDNADQASVYVAFEEVADSFSQQPGIATETDTALKAGGIAMALQRADATNTALALSRLLIRATGLASTTDTAFQRNLAYGVTSAVETDTAFALSNPIVPIGRSDETDTALALTAVQIRAAGRADETDLALQRNLAHGVGRANESSLALPRGIVLATGRANETDSSIARGLGQPTGRAAEVDTALALAQGAGLVVGRADEADTAFNLPPIFNTGRSDETDAAFARAPLLVRGTGRADETDATFALSRLFIRTTGQGNETDLAVQRVATVLAATGLAGEIDVAETLFPPLIAGEGYIKEVRLKWLDDRIQRVYRKRTVEEA